LAVKPPINRRALLVPAVTFVAGVAITVRAASSGSGRMSPIGLLSGILVSASAAVTVFLLIERAAVRREATRLRELVDEKDEFLAAVSHELRTPLTSVVGFAEILRDGGDGLSRTERDELVGHIADEASAMEVIVEDLLATARLERGAVVRVSSERVDDVAGEVRRLIERTGALRGAQITVEGTGAAMADAGRLHQIVRNLLVNAVEHGTPPVEVSIRSDADRVGIVVRDRGGGIPDETAEAMFDRRRSAPDQTAGRSTGVGLWLSRELALRMGGDLRYLDDGGGTAFELVLPTASPPDEPGEPSQRR
jgi:signal transduction histidine kinase